MFALVDHGGLLHRPGGVHRLQSVAVVILAKHLARLLRGRGHVVLRVELMVLTLRATIVHQVVVSIAAANIVRVIILAMSGHKQTFAFRKIIHLELLVGVCIGRTGVEVVEGGKQVLFGFGVQSTTITSFWNVCCPKRNVVDQYASIVTLLTTINKVWP